MLALNAIIVTPELLRQITDIDEFKGLWTGLERHTTGLHLLGDVAHHSASFKQLLEPLQNHPISPDIIKALHTGLAKETGHYKSTKTSLEIKDNSKTIGTLETATPEQVEPLLQKLCDWVNESLQPDAPIHPLITIAIFTSVFLQISPFEKGNQTVIRFLIMLTLLKSGYLYAPYTPLDSIMEDKAEAIFHALKENQRSLETGKPDWSAWLTCFMELLQAQKSELYTRLYEKETELQHLSTLSNKIMELFKTHKRLQMKEIITLTNGRRATIKLRLNELTQGDYLKRHGKGRSTWYALN